MESQKITTLQGLFDKLGNRNILEQFKISEMEIEKFGKLTGDENDHNFRATAKFPKPVVQDSFYLSLFGKFHKQICQIEHTDPVLIGMDAIKFLKPICANDIVVPILSVGLTDTLNHPCTQVTWLYELRDVESNILMKAQVEIGYYPAK